MSSAYAGTIFQTVNPFNCEMYLTARQSKDFSLYLFRSILTKIGVAYQTNYTLGEHVYDFAIEKDKTVVQVCPSCTDYANTCGLTKESGISTSLHRDEERNARNLGWRCIHVWDWDDPIKVVMLLQQKKTIYARKCVVADVRTDEANLFYNMHHLQGTCKGKIVNLGLYYDNNLVALMSFGKPRYAKKYGAELLRFCEDSEYRVVGGASKLFKYYVEHFNPESIISYCDSSKFSGRVYSYLGMHRVDTSQPTRVWSRGSKRVTDNLLLRTGYDSLFNTSYGKGTSNDELMIQNGWLPVYDCGQQKFVWTAEKDK